jgi:hypothetical protein
MEWLAIPLALLAFAFIIHGVPSLLTVHKHTHYHRKGKDD